MTGWFAADPRPEPDPAVCRCGCDFDDHTDDIAAMNEEADSA